MSVQELLLHALEDLVDEDFATFKWHLSQKQLEQCRPLSRSFLEKAKRTEIVSRLLSSSGPDSTVALCVCVLQKMNNNFTAQELQQEYAALISSGAASAEGPASGRPGGPGPGPGAPAAPGGSGLSVAAQGNSVIVAPIVSGGTAGTWNITISK